MLRHPNTDLWNTDTTISKIIEFAGFPGLGHAGGPFLRPPFSNLRTDAAWLSGKTLF